MIDDQGLEPPEHQVPPIAPGDSSGDEVTRYWTARRVFLTVVIVVTLIAFLALTFSGLFQPPITLPELPPPPTSSI